MTGQRSNAGRARHRLYDDPQWKAGREQYLAANPWCVFCARAGKRHVPAAVVDHRIPHRGDRERFFDRENWQGLCWGHHSRTKQRIEARRRTAFSADGWPA